MRLNPDPDVRGSLDHGDCFGADAQAHILARKLGWRVIIHPPIELQKRAMCVGDEVWPSKPYLVRNHDIVANTDRMVATPRGYSEEMRSGTWATVRYALKIGRTVYVVTPDGDVRVCRQ